MRVTISDIAKATGYSKTTVSFAFNNPRRISKEARKKVLDAARDLGYIPDPVARSLASGRHGTIGLLLPQPIPIAFQNPYMVHLVRGLGTICNGEGLSLTMLPPKRGNLLNSVKGAAVDGLVTIGLRPEEEIVTVIRHRHIPFVSIDGPADVGVPSVRINDREAARLAMAHLLDHGHCRIAVVVMDDTTEADHEEYSEIGRERLAGYRDAARQHGLPWENVVEISAECSLAGGRETGRRVIEGHPDVTGVVAMSDILAIGIIQTLSDHGRSVPGEVSVVGFDDIPEASLLSPALTTVWQPAEEKGTRAAELLVGMIRGADTPPDEVVELRCRLVPRATVSRVRCA